MPSKRRQPVPAWVAQETAQADLQEISELDKIRRVEAFWKTQSRQQQSELLTFPVKDAKANAVKFDREAELRAKQKFEEEQWAIQGRKHHGELCKPGCSGKDCGWVLHPRKVARPTQEQLATGLKRLATAKSWNKWQWGPKHPAFHDAMAFRKHLETEHIDKELQPLLPKATGTSLEQKAVKDLSQRMGTMEKALAPALKALLQSVEDLEDARKHVCVFDPPSPSHQLEHKRIRNAFQGMIWYFFSELRQEDESLYSSLEEPVASHIWGMLKEWPGGGTSTKLCFDDLPKLPAEQVYKIADWLSDKVGLIASGHAHILLQSDLALKDSYSSDDDSIDDISLFVLTEDQRHLTVNQEWLAHLEKHMVCECGQVHLVGSGQTCGGIGAVLTWAYGRHQLKYEYGRYIANKPLDKAPTVEETFERLHKGLKRRQDMLEKLKVAKDMKRRLQISKRKLAALAATDNLRLTEADKEVLKHTDWNVFLEECQACCVPHDHECTEDKPCSNCQSSDSSGLQPSSANAGDKKANNTTTTSTSSSSNSTGSSQDGVKALRDSTMLALLRRELQLYLTNALLFILSNEQLVSRMKDSAALQQQNQAVLKCSRDTLRLIPEALVRRKAALSAGQRKKNTAEVAAKLHQHFPQYSMPVLVQWCEAINLSPGMAERVQGLKKAMADDKQTLAEQVTMYKHSISQGKVIEALLDELNHLVTCTRAIEAGTMKDKPSVEVPYPVAADEGSAQQPCPEPGSEPPSHHYSQRVLNQDSSNETGNDSASSGVGQQDSPDSAKQDAEAPTRLSDCEADLYAWQRLGPIALWPFPTSCISYDHKVYCPVKERTSSEGLSSQQPCEEQSHGCDSQDPCDAGSKTTAALGAAAASDSDSPSQEWCVLLREAYFPVWLLLQSGRSHFCKDIWADMSDMGRKDGILYALSNC